MRIVRIDSPFTHWPLLLQTPGASGIWNDLQFRINDGVGEADFWVVIHGLRETTRCRVPPRHVLLMNIEPPTVMRYPPRFIEQFAAVHTCSGFKFRETHVIEDQPAIPWWIGVNQLSPHVAAADGHVGGYDQFLHLPPPPKTREVSIISSNRLISPSHVRRAKLIDYLERRLGNRLTIFGPRPGEASSKWVNKWEAVAPFRYHIAIENSRHPHYWTEKLADPLLVDAHPIYCGCPNWQSYFPREAITDFEFEPFDRAADTIERALDAKVADQSAAARFAARKLILDRYNLFAVIARWCSQIERSPERQDITLRSIDESKSRASKIYWGLRHTLMQRSGLRRLLKRSG